MMRDKERKLEKSCDLWYGEGERDMGGGQKEMWWQGYVVFERIIDHHRLKNTCIHTLDKTRKEKEKEHKTKVDRVSDSRGYRCLLERTRFHFKHEEIIIFTDYLEWFESLRF